MKEQLEARIKKLEADLALYNEFMNDPEKPLDDKKVVSFKVMFEMIAFDTLAEVLQYKPLESTNVIMQGLKGASEYVSVDGGKVVISPMYKEVMKMKDDYLKTIKN
jgi:hypothetical protein